MIGTESHVEKITEILDIQTLPQQVADGILERIIYNEKVNSLDLLLHNEMIMPAETLIEAASAIKTTLGFKGYHLPEIPF